MFRTRSTCCYCFLCTLLGLARAWLMLSGSAQPIRAQGPKGPVSFINDVAPIFKENCFACHDAKKKKGKLEITSYETFRKGGASDDPVVPGNSKASHIIELLTPPPNHPLPPPAIDTPLPHAQPPT